MEQLLLAAIFVPAAAAAVVAALGSKRADAVKAVALGAALVALAASIMLLARFSPSTDAASPVAPSTLFGWDWASLPLGDRGLADAAALRFELGLDGMGVWMVFLSSLLGVSAILVSWQSVDRGQATYYSLLLLLQTAMAGVFCSYDVVSFYVFFEFTLAPLFFLVGIWGGPRRQFAARKFFLFTLAGSLVTLVGLSALVLMAAKLDGGKPTFSIPELARRYDAAAKSHLRREALARPAAANGTPTAPPRGDWWWRRAQVPIFLALFLGFAVKAPLFPLHTWLPLAHVEAPTAGSVLLAGVLLKLGTLGFMRFTIPMLPYAWETVGFPLVGVLSVCGIIYGALCALAQTDVKRLVAYSSVSHMGFCTLGLASLNVEGFTGCFLQMLNHGLSTGALFLLVGVVYDRLHTRDMHQLGGLAARLPMVAVLLVISCLSSAGLPGLNGFLGEFLCLAAMFRQSAPLAVAACLGIVLGAWYLFEMMRRVLFGPVVLPEGVDPHHVVDLNVREWLAVLPLVAMFFLIGLYPETVLRQVRPDMQRLAIPYAAPATIDADADLP